MSTVYFTEDHEWIQIEGDEATIGITNHAQEQLGDLVFVELPEVGSKVSKGDAAIVVESVKAASDVFSPVDGEILAVNSSLEAEPELVNASAEKDGWLVKIRLEDPSQLDGLLDQTAYMALVG